MFALVLAAALGQCPGGVCTAPVYQPQAYAPAYQQPVYYPQPVYRPAPVYQPAPVYYSQPTYQLAPAYYSQPAYQPPVVRSACPGGVCAR